MLSDFDMKSFAGLEQMTPGLVMNNLDAYQTVDLFLGIRSESQAWDVGIFARNLFDEDQIIRGNSPGLHCREPTGYQAVDVVAPRLVGVRPSYNF